MRARIGGFRPHLVPTLFTIAAVSMCLALGVWQIQRLHWKEGLIAQRQAALRAPPVALPPSLAAAQRLDLRRVVAGGVLLNDKEILVHAIGPQGGAGFDVLTPLRRGGDAIVFVNRGFVPTALADRRRRAAGDIAGTVRIAGRLRSAPQAKPGWFIPDNRPDSGEWFWIDLGAMTAADRLGEVAPYYIAADATPNPGGWPKGGVSLPELPNHHLQYAITWFSLAAAAAVIYVLAQRGGGGGAGEDDRIRRT
jgi:surfeit locus 1 family protein